MTGEPFTPRKQTELENPFDRGDGSIYFTSGGTIVRAKDRRWEIVVQLGERINAVIAEPDGTFACAGNKGVLHRFDGRTWSRLDLGTNTVTGLCRLRDGRYVCGGLDGMVAIVDGQRVTRVDIGKSITSCAAGETGAWIGGDGVYVLDGSRIERELDVFAQSLLVVGDDIYVGGAQVGLAGRAQLWRRVKPTVWQTVPAPPSTTEHDFFSLAWWRDAVWIANVTQLARYAPGGEIEIVSGAGVSRYLGIARDRLIICASGQARSYDGATFTSLI